MAKLLINMVGLPRFELGTSCTPSKRDTRLRYSPIRSGTRPEHFAALQLGWRRLLTELLSSLSRIQNRKRTVPCSDLGPPVCSTGDSPLPWLPVPSMRFNIEVD